MADEQQNDQALKTLWAEAERIPDAQRGQHHHHHHPKPIPVQDIPSEG